MAFEINFRKMFPFSVADVRHVARLLLFSGTNAQIVCMMFSKLFKKANLERRQGDFQNGSWQATKMKGFYSTAGPTLPVADRSWTISFRLSW